MKWRKKERKNAERKPNETKRNHLRIGVSTRDLSTNVAEWFPFHQHVLIFDFSFVCIAARTSRSTQNIWCERGKYAKWFEGARASAHKPSDLLIESENIIFIMCTAAQQRIFDFALMQNNFYEQIIKVVVYSVFVCVCGLHRCKNKRQLMRFA